MRDDTTCPLPRASDAVELAHGGGGRSARRLLHELILPALGLSPTQASLDAAVLSSPVGARLAFTTDATVARPRFFPGGDLGTLAVYGCVNDLACVGARPHALSLSLLVEEGFSLDELRAVLASVARAAERVGVRVVTGDTKVLERGRGDGLYLSTAGVGVVVAPHALGPASITVGDAVLVSGDVGRHGVAILSARESLGFDTTLTSDCAAVTPLLDALLDAGVRVHALRDPTRGGLAATLNELCLDAGVSATIAEASVPVDPRVTAACELLGLDACSMACEGRLVAFVHRDDASAALAAWRAHPLGEGAAMIGVVTSGPAGRVVLTTTFGTRRILDFVSGEALPRIC